MTSLLVSSFSANVYEQIQFFREQGDFSSALEVAREIQPNFEEDAFFNTLVSELENDFLALGASRRLFDEQGNPRVKLIQLLEETGMDISSLEALNIGKINEWAQNHFLRKGERWDDQSSRFEELKSRITPLLGELGFINGIDAHFSDYQGAIVHGASLEIACARIDCLIEHWQNGIRFSDLYFLTAARPLDERFENQDRLFRAFKQMTFRAEERSLVVLPKTEADMIRCVWERAQVPEDMRRNVSIHYIVAPMKEDLNGERRVRPNTDDTVHKWMEQEPAPGRYLAVSNNPYINRQDMVVRSIVPSQYTFETVGPPASEQEKVAIILDEVARLIFQTKRYLESRVPK